MSFRIALASRVSTPLICFILIFAFVAGIWTSTPKMFMGMRGVFGYSSPLSSSAHATPCQIFGISKRQRSTLPTVLTALRIRLRPLPLPLLRCALLGFSETAFHCCFSSAGERRRLKSKVTPLLPLVIFLFSLKIVLPFSSGPVLPLTLGHAPPHPHAGFCLTFCFSFSCRFLGTGSGRPWLRPCSCFCILLGMKPTLWVLFTFASCLFTSSSPLLFSFCNTEICGHLLAPQV